MLNLITKSFNSVFILWFLVKNTQLLHHKMFVHPNLKIFVYYYYFFFFNEKSFDILHILEKSHFISVSSVKIGTFFSRLKF